MENTKNTDWNSQLRELEQTHADAVRNLSEMLSAEHQRYADERARIAAAMADNRAEQTADEHKIYLSERINVKAAAEYVGYSPRTLYNMAAQGEIPCIRYKGRLYFQRAELDRWRCSDINLPTTRVADQIQILADAYMAAHPDPFTHKAARTRRAAAN